MSWLDALFGGLARIRFNGSQLPAEGALNFTGAGVSAVTDNPTDGSTDVDITGGGGGSFPAGTNGQTVTYTGTTPTAIDSVTSDWTLYTDEDDPTLVGYFNTINDDGTIGDGSVGGYWRRTGAPLQNGTIDFLITFILGAGYGGTGDFVFRVLPAGLVQNAKFMIHSRVVMQDQSNPENNASGYCVDLADGTVRVIVDISPAGAGVDSNIEPTSPFTFASGDTIRIQGSMQLFNDC